MKLNFTGNKEDILQGAEILSSRLGFEIGEGGIEVNIVKQEKGFKVEKSGEKATIFYSEKIQLFRALGILCEKKSEDFKTEENIKFEKNGVMFDASRNSVMTVRAIKDFIEIMAIMGLNLIMMYTEDTYEIPEYEYFGYMRGRYSQEELRECDDYADIFGIEMMPCIQTLSHLAKMLKWSQFADVMDTDLIMNVGEEKTYEVIKTMIKAATAPYRSNRIHVGLDEAFELGRGRYLNKHPYTKASVLMAEHSKRVNAICKELGLEMMMWSDMFFREGTNGRYIYPEGEFTEEFKKSLPKDLEMAYWDYYSLEKETYDGMLRRQIEICPNAVFAGGIWIWGGMTANYKIVFDRTVKALSSCVDNNVKQVIATMWGDCGSQTNVYETLLGLQLYAEIGYGYEFDYEHIKKRFFACTGENADAFVSLTDLDDLGQKEFGTYFNGDGNPSEYLLWQNILMGMLDAHIDIENISELYKERKLRYKKYAEESKNYKNIFEYSYHLANVLEIKADLGLKVKKAYDEKNMAELLDICDNVLPELRKRVEEFTKVYRDLWYYAYKGFGFEVIDGRLGAIIANIETTKYRLKQFINGEAAFIEELEEKRLPYKARGYDYRDGLNMRTLCYSSYAVTGYFSLGNTDK